MSGPASGSHLGRKLADIMHETRVAAAAKIIPAETEHRAAYHRSFMEGVETDLAPMFRDMFGDLMDDPDVPDQAKAYLAPLLEPQHQGQFFLTVAALVGLALSGPAAAAAGWLQQLQNASYHAHGNLRMSPPEAALAFVKGAADYEAMADEARYAGMTRDIFNGLVAITGEPPGPQELGEAFRRGFIDQGTYEHGIRQSRVRNEWIPTMVQLRYAPPSAGQVIAAAVEGHLDEADARHRMSEAGINPDNYGWLYETAGRPPGTQEMLSLLNRGLVDEAQVVAAIRESDVKNKYIPAILHMRDHLLPQRSLVSMIRHGVIDDADGHRRLRMLGIDETAATALVREAHSTATTHTRELSVAETVGLYNEGLIDHGRALAMLEALRFSGDAAEQILGLADVKREHALIAASVRRVHAAYVSRKIDRNGASAALDALHLDTAAREQALGLWDLERETTVRHLTEAQVVRAWKAGLIDDAGFIDRHRTMGYSQDDAELLLTLDRQ